MGDRSPQAHLDPTAELLGALRLASPALPIGAFAYSQAIETAVDRGWVVDRASAGAWIAGLLEYSVGRLDVPILLRLHRAWSADDHPAVAKLEARLLAARESSELQAEELNIGAALVRLNDDLEATQAAGTVSGAAPRPCTYLGAFSLVAVQAGLPQATTVVSYCYAWLEHQTSAATRLVPLGQTEGQAILTGCLRRIGDIVAAGQEIADDEIGALSPGLAIASALHETQYTRLFRS
jgi:urease accessory protein